MSTKKLNILVLPGDGIGVEVTEAAVPILEALNIPATLHFGDIGWRFWTEEGNPLPARTWEWIEKADAVLLGATCSKPQREAREALPAHLKNSPAYVSPILQLRQKLDLFANVRPFFDPQGKQNFEGCIIRENTEGLYSGCDFYPLPADLYRFIQQHKDLGSHAENDWSCTLRLQSREGLKRIFAYAFAYADAQGMRRVTFADKPNVLRNSSAFARECFEAQACAYPDIQADILNVDAVALGLIRRPEAFGVIVAENMFGDILSDVAAGVMGGLGFAPSANIGEKKSYFEPVHGSGPRMAPGKANPCAMFLSIGMLLRHHGFTKEAETLKQAVMETLREGRFQSYDLGGSSSTRTMADAIIARCRSLQSSANGNAPLPEKKWQRLAAYSAAEISDALDACGIEGCLPGIKPLSAGSQVLGPAYTITYAAYASDATGFKGAADYIDTVPADSVILIDNQGREDCTVWGELLTQTAVQKNIRGTVVHGAVRDVDAICDSAYPVFCKNHTMRSGKNRVYKAQEQTPVTMNAICIHPGDILFGDTHGVLVIPAAMLDTVLAKLVNIRATEQSIREAVKAGSSLKQARKIYAYAKPWENQAAPLRKTASDPVLALTEEEKNR